MTIPPQTKDLGNGHSMVADAELDLENYSICCHTMLECTNSSEGFAGGFLLLYFDAQKKLLGYSPVLAYEVPHAFARGSKYVLDRLIDHVPPQTEIIALALFSDPKGRLGMLEDCANTIKLFFANLQEILDDTVKATKKWCDQNPVWCERLLIVIAGIVQQKSGELALVIIGTVGQLHDDDASMSKQGIPMTEEAFKAMINGTVGQLHDDNASMSKQGIPMTEEAFKAMINIESPYKYEFIDGQIYDMTSSSPRQSAIAGRIDREFQEQLGKRGPCRTHRNQYVLIPEEPPVVPDVVITCDSADWDEDKCPKPFRIQIPLIVVEVLSPGTMRYDHVEKFTRYRRCPSLEVYILASQEKRQVEVYRKENGWKPEIFIDDQVITLDQLDLELPLNEIYEGIL